MTLIERLTTLLAVAKKGDLSVHAKEPGLASGRYISQTINATALTTVAGVANRLDLYPFVPARNLNINEIAIEVTTLLALAAARVGIYASDASGNPAALIVGSSANLDCTTAGVKASTVTTTPLIAGNVYWLAVLSSLAPTFRGVATAALHTLGHDATLNTIYTCRRATATFGALPTPAPATTLTSSLAVWVRLKLA